MFLLNKFKRKPLLFASGAAALVVIIYLVAPVLLAQRLAMTIGKISGLAFASQSSRLEFSPPGLVFEQAKLSNAAGQVLLDAETLHVPFSAVGNISGTPITFENGGLHAFAVDGREHFGVAKIYGSATLNSDGSLLASGTGDFGKAHVIVEATLASLARALSEGSPVDFTLSSKTLKAGYSGRIKLNDGFDLAGTMSLETADARDFFALTGANLSAMQQGWPLNLTAAIETKADALSFSNIEARLGGMKGLGNVTYSAPGGKPRLTLDLGMDVLDLSVFGLGAPSPTGGWSEKPYDLTGLDSLDAIWHISSNGLRFGLVAIGPGELDGSLSNRILQASYATKAAPDFKAHFNLDAQGFQPAFDATFNAAQLDGKAALLSLAGFDWLEGAVSLSGKLATSGTSPAEMVSKLSGNLEIKLNQGNILGMDAAKLLQTASSQPVEGWNGGATNNVEAKASVNFSDGIATVQEGQFAASDVSAQLSGDIDMLRQAIELKIQRSTSAGSKNTGAVSVSGHWDAPKFSSNKSP